MTSHGIRAGLQRATTHLGAVLLVATLATIPAPTAAQERLEPTLTRVQGVVYDILSGTGVGGASVLVESVERGVLADEDGVFTLDDVPEGPQVLFVRQFGYMPQTLAVTVTAGSGELVEIELVPQPIMLDGVTAVVDNIETMNRRLRFRRRASAAMTWAYDQERLLQSASGTALDFLNWETFLRTVPCDHRAVMSSICVIRRGQVVEPRVYVDEVPAFGLDELESYPTTSLYLVEVYSAGSEIRAYTHQFMERMARKPMALIPLNLWVR